jgi:hypothetical protein
MMKEFDGQTNAQSEPLPEKPFRRLAPGDVIRLPLLALLIISTLGWLYLLGKTGLALVRWIMPLPT